MLRRALLTALAAVLSTGVAAAAEPATSSPATAPGAPAPAPAAASPEATGGAAPTAESAPTEPAEAVPPSEPSAIEAAPPVAEVSEPPPEGDPEPETTEPPPEVVAVPYTEEAPPKPPSGAGLFAQGRVSIGGMIGFSTATGGGSSRSWFILGVGAGVFVLDGLQVHADTTFWIGDPFLATLTPGVRYVFHMVPVVKPYVGTFYRHYFVTGALSDSDSLGGRAGVNFMLSPNSYVGGGVVYEHFLDSALFSNPDQVYPEITIAFAF